MRGGDAFFYAFFADEEVDFVGRAAHVAEVGVGQLAEAVDDAAHDGDFDAAQVAGGGLDALGGLLEVEEGAATGGAGDELGFDGAGA